MLHVYLAKASGDSAQCLVWYAGRPTITWGVITEVCQRSFVVGGPRLREATLAQADDGFACEDVLDDWTLEQELDGGKAAAGRTEVAFCEEYNYHNRINH